MSAPPLSGKAALVTGSGVRVGRAIAIALAEAGSDVAVHFRSSAAPAEETAAAIRARGRTAVVFRADLAVAGECDALARDAISTLGGLDFLVHSAANFHHASLADTDDSLWNDAMAVNARAALLLAREAAPTLAARRGRIVLVSDLLAVQPVRGYVAHSASKAAVEGLVRGLAVELAPDVSVNGVAPGTVLPPEGTPEETAARWARQTPLRRNGSPSDVAAAVLFFCTGPAFVTGQILRVDGGKSLT